MMLLHVVYNYGKKATSTGPQIDIGNYEAVLL